MQQTIWQEHATARRREQAADPCIGDTLYLRKAEICPKAILL